MCKMPTLHNHNLAPNLRKVLHMAVLKTKDSYCDYMQQVVIILTSSYFFRAKYAFPMWRCAFMQPSLY